MVKNFLLILTLCVGVSWGTNYYVDYESGDDSCNGLTQETAWKFCPGDSQFTGTYTKVDGDTIWFKGGVRYLGGSIKLQYSNIAYVGSRDWGTGKPVIDGENVLISYRQYGFRTVSTTLKKNITIDNIEFTRQGGADGIDSANPTCGQNVVTGYSGYGVYINALTNGITIKNCKFHRLGWWDTYGGAGLTNILGYGVYIKGGTQNLLVDSCEFDRVGNTGIEVSGSNIGVTQNIEISNCEVHHYIRWGIDIAFSSSDAIIKDVKIHDNYIHDFTNYDFNGITYPRWIDTCSGKAGNAPHTDMITLRRASSIGNITGGDTTTPWRIYNNTFATNDTTGGGTALIFITFCMPGEIWIYNNVVKGDRQSYGFIYATGPGGGVVGGPRSKHRLLIANNTLYHAEQVVEILGRYMEDSTEVEIYNNINYGYGDEWGFAYGFKDSLCLPNAGKINNNLWYTGRSDSLTGWVYNPNSNYVRFNNLKSIGYDSNSVFARPQFVDTSYGLGLQSNSNDVRLQSTSPARNRGKNLSMYFTTDKDGNPRPSEGSWDIGAYQYSSKFFGRSGGTTTITISGATHCNNVATLPYTCPGVGIVTLDSLGVECLSSSTGYIRLAIYNGSGKLVVQGKDSVLVSGGTATWRYQKLFVDSLGADVINPTLIGGEGYSFAVTGSAITQTKNSSISYGQCKTIATQYNSTGYPPDNPCVNSASTTPNMLCAVTPSCTSPTITSVSPTSGRAGSQIRLVGSSLSPVDSVLINSVKCTIDSTKSDTCFARSPVWSPRGYYTPKFFSSGGVDSIVHGYRIKTPTFGGSATITGGR